MAADTPDPSLSRLAGADPAAGAPTPDLEAIRARAQANSTVVPLTTRRRTPWVVGGVAAAVVLLAGVALAGVAIGRVTAPAPDPVAAAPVEEGIPVVGAPSPQLPTVAGQGANPNSESLPGSPAKVSGLAADASMIYPGYGVTLLPADDLVDVPGTAVGYRLDASDVDPEALAEQLAAVFGVSGAPVRQDYGWAVGPVDGSGPAIWIGDDGMVSWSYSDPTRDPWACAGGVTPEPAPADGASSDGASSDSGSVEPGAPESCKPAVEPISERDAVRAARKVLNGLGVSDDPAAGIDIEWEASSDDYTTSVTAWQRVEGQRTQLAWSFTFAGEQIAWANGFAAGLEAIPAYPIVGAKTAVLRSSDPKYASFGPTPLDGVIAMEADAGTATSSSSTPSVRTSNPERVQVWWDPATVTSAEQTLAQYWQPDGTLLILPAYRLTTADDRGTWAVIAVAETAVEFVAPTP